MSVFNLIYIKLQTQRYVSYKTTRRQGQIGEHFQFGKIH